MAERSWANRWDWPLTAENVGISCGTAFLQRKTKNSGREALKKVVISALPYIIYEWIFIIFVKNGRMYITVYINGGIYETVVDRRALL